MPFSVVSASKGLFRGVRRAGRTAVIVAGLVVPGVLAGAVARADRPAVLHGAVTDPSGAALAGATVCVRRSAGDRCLAATSSDGRGTYRLTLAPGEYDVRFEVQGFAPLLRPVRLEPAGDQRLDVALELTALADSIVVRAPDGYTASSISTATRTPTPLADVPQSVTVITRRLMDDQSMTGIGDVVRYVPGIALHQGENNRDQVVIRGNSSSADFFVDGVRDDAQYYRDLYNLDRVEALKGPNAMIFGRGGGGGVINRVTKEAGFGALREVALTTGAHGDRRLAADFDQAVNERLALRLNGVYERSGSFRHGVELERSGVAPTLTYLPSDATKITVSYEHFRDRRGADRGITSVAGRPAAVPIDTYFGNPDDSHVRARVDLASAALEHRAGAVLVRSRLLFGDYNRGYQNYVPGAVTADRTRVSLTAYNNATLRNNLFSQTDVSRSAGTGAVRHTLLAGVELGRQRTANLRHTGYFDGQTSLLVPLSNPTTAARAVFRQSATDADNTVRATVGAAYAQDQIAFGDRVQVLAGLRVDRFDLAFHNRRNGDDLGRRDDLVSPRLGLVVKPLAALSLYGSRSVSYLPSSGDQFSSLTTVTEQLEPERFTNTEVGAKWSASPDLYLTAALYRLDRTHTRAVDPNDPTRIVQTGSQRTNGLELGVDGRISRRWSVAGGAAWQDAFVTRATASARAGAIVAQVPRRSFSLWSQVQVLPRLALALGVIQRSRVFATIDDTVTLPGYVRVDFAATATLGEATRLRIQVENLGDRRYWANADSNTNLSPGAPRAVRAVVQTRF